MNRFKSISLFILWGAVGGGAVISAEDETGDNPLIRPSVGEGYRELIENSPFTRSLNLPHSILLTGVAEIGGKQVATLLNPATKELYLVSDEPNAQGWRLVEVAHDYDLEKVVAKVVVAGGEVVTVRFDERQIKPEKGKSGRPQGQHGGHRQDARPPPTDEDRRRFREHVKQRMSKLTEEQRRRVGEIIKEKNIWGNKEMSDRQKGETFIKILDHVERGDGRKR